MNKDILKKAFYYLCFIGKIESQEDLSSKMGYNNKSVSEAMNGKGRALTERFLIKFNATFDNIFNQEWLLTGEGEMLADKPIQAKPLSLENASDEELHREAESRLWSIIFDYQANNRRLNEENSKLRAEVDRLRTLLNGKGKSEAV